MWWEEGKWIFGHWCQGQKEVWYLMSQVTSIKWHSSRGFGRCAPKKHLALLLSSAWLRQSLGASLLATEWNRKRIPGIRVWNTITSMDLCIYWCSPILSAQITCPGHCTSASSLFYSTAILVWGILELETCSTSRTHTPFSSSCSIFLLAFETLGHSYLFNQLVSLCLK
jgi:hypothetical protein